MSKYTTEVRYICESAAGLSHSVGGNDVQKVIALARPKIFDFDYPIFSEEYREILETKILMHFYTREIGLESVGLWKLKLNTKLNEVMPYYNKLYNSELMQLNPFLTKEYTRSVTEHEDKGEHGTTSDDTTTNLNQTQQSNTDSINKFSDTPQGSINNLLNDKYLTNATVDESGSTNKLTSDDNVSRVGAHDNTGTRDGQVIENVQGFDGVNINKLLLDYRKTFLNIDMLVIKELEPLFFQLW